MNESEMQEAIRTAVACAPSMRSLARSWGVSVSYLSDLCKGKRRPGPSILKHFGLKVKVIRVYEEDANIRKSWPRTVPVSAIGVPAP
jgi:hypothetical protein